MTELYLSAFWVRRCADCIAACAALLCAVSAALMLFRFGRKKYGLVGACAEAVNLLQVCILAYIPALAQYGISNGICMDSGLNVLRYAAFVAVICANSAAAAQNFRVLQLVPVLCSFVCLPFMESSGAFVPLLFAASGLMLMRGAAEICICSRRIRSGLSALSVKQAVDSLNTGIMFSDKSGFILLVNRRMREVLFEITGREWSNSRKLWKLLSRGQTQSLAGERIFRMRSGAAVRFCAETLSIKKREYVQLTASDITEEFRLTEELESEKQKLAAQKKELEGMLEYLKELMWQEELMREKSRVHDVIGQRIVILRQAIASGADKRTVIDSISRLTDEVCENDGVDPLSHLEEIEASFKSIGVEVSLEGELPDTEYAADTVLALLRECATNAVRHGLATEVKAACKKERGGWKMKVINNGAAPEKIIEGNGIVGMRRRVGKAGSLEIRLSPFFMISAWIKDEPND